MQNCADFSQRDTRDMPSHAVGEMSILLVIHGTWLTTGPDIISVFEFPESLLRTRYDQKRGKLDL